MEHRKSVCPKCESLNTEKLVCKVSTFPHTHHMECTNCGAITHDCLTQEEAIARWNAGWMKEKWE